MVRPPFDLYIYGHKKRSSWGCKLVLTTQVSKYYVKEGTGVNRKDTEKDTEKDTGTSVGSYLQTLLTPPRREETRTLPLALGGHGFLPFSHERPLPHSDPPTNQADPTLTYHHASF